MTRPDGPGPGAPDPAPAAAAREDAAPGARPTLLEQMGGPGGLLASVLPVVVFVVANTAAGLTAAIWASLAAAVALAAWRLVRREPLQPAVSGALGVGVSAFIAYRTGEARAYFAYGIWYSLVAGIAFLVSVLVRWPLVGVAWSALNSTDRSWRAHPRARRAYAVATLVWAAFFLARFGVQRALYNADETGWLGVARLAMGLPLTAVALVVTVWAVRRADRVVVAAR